MKQDHCTLLFTAVLLFPTGRYTACSTIRGLPRGEVGPNASNQLVSCLPHLQTGCCWNERERWVAVLTIHCPILLPVHTCAASIKQLLVCLQPEMHSNFYILNEQHLLCCSLTCVLYISSTGLLTAMQGSNTLEWTPFSAPHTEFFLKLLHVCPQDQSSDCPLDYLFKCICYV